MTLPKIDEATIRENSSSSSFERGEAVYRRGQVEGLELRARVLWARVEGSEDRPYRVTVRFLEDGDPEAECTCPYDWGGWCKHVVAALLAYVGEPELAEVRPSAAELLEGLGEAALRRAFLHVLGRHPEVLPTLELHLSLGRAAAPDAEAVTAQVRALLRNAADPYDAFSRDPAILQLLVGVGEAVARGDATSALALLSGLTEACVAVFEGIYEHDYWDYEGETPFDDLDARWAEVALGLDLSEEEREGLLTTVLDWRERLGEFGEDAFYAAEAAFAQGWDDPAVLAQLRGERAETGEADFVGDLLTEARLSVLQRQGREAEYLNLAMARGRAADALGMMLRQGRLSEVMESFRAVLNTPEDALSVARALRAQGEGARALEVTRFGLDLPSPQDAWFGGPAGRLGLAEWAAELAEELSETGMALAARRIAFAAAPSLERFLHLERLAGAAWPELREKLLEEVARLGRVEAQVDIFLHARRLGLAMRAVEGADAYATPLLRRVMDAALPEHADWVLETARRRAERIMDEGLSQSYPEAAAWLERVRDAHDRLGRFEEWTRYLSQLEETHKRKYRLMEHLRALEP